MLVRILESIFRNLKQLFIFFKLLFHRKIYPNYDLMIFFDHSLGGGTGTYTRNFLSNLDNKYYLYVTNYKIFSFDVAYKIKYKNSIFIIRHENLFSYLKCLQIKEIYVNSIVSYSCYSKIIDMISELYNNKDIFVTVAFHDYYPICRHLNLYCNHQTCKKYCSLLEIKSWRTQWKKLFSIASELRVFSERSKTVLLNFIPEYKDKIVVIPHSVKYLKNLTPIQYPKLPITIGIMGDISSEIKGLYVLRELSRKYIIHLFGKTRLNSKNIIMHGCYTLSSIRQLLIDNHINLMLFISVCEETFSYVTSEIVALGLPVICFDIGAQSEKIKKYDKGFVVKNLSEMMARIDDLIVSGESYNEPQI